MQLILASQSPYRRAQLESLGVRFMAQASKVDEAQLKNEGPKDLRELTRFLAQKKAHSLRPLFPAAVIIGSDQVAELDGERLDKPMTPERAEKQLLKMQDKTHRLITSIAVCAPGREVIHTNITELQMRPLDLETIRRYLELDQPWDCAGSYKFERGGAALIAKVQTEDASAIQGLPLLALVHALEELELPISKFWRTT